MKVMRDTVTVFETTIDLCDPKKKRPEMIDLSLAGFGIPFKCPVPADFTFCRRNETVFTFSEATRKLLEVFLVLTPTVDVTVVITHDTGKSCFKVGSELFKN